MALTRAFISKKSKKVSLRKCPWDPFHDQEVLAKTYEPGDLLKIDTDKVVYDWTDRSFYEVHDYYTGAGPIGYVATDAVIIDRGGRSNGGNRNTVG